MEETLGERVRRLRKDKDWTQVALAYNADRAPSVVSQVETGKREPELSTIKALAEALDVDWRYLLLGDQLPKVPSRSSTKPPEASEGERLLTRMIRRLIADMEADAERWEATALTGEVSLAVYKELVARRISTRSSLGDLDDVSETLGVNISDRRGSPLRRVRRDLQSAFNRWNVARTVLIDLHFDTRMKAEEGAPEEGAPEEGKAEEEESREVTYLEEKRAERDATEQMKSQSNVIGNVG